mmetsp:Transcript_16965/g.29009  ORF Transcript_16965/g.29009 Transcript_16965/m.29009 type:complete len:123 (+) Transcript_16965:184-552(+)
MTSKVLEGLRARLSAAQGGKAVAVSGKTKVGDPVSSTNDKAKTGPAGRKKTRERGGFGFGLSGEGDGEDELVGALKELKGTVDSLAETVKESAQALRSDSPLASSASSAAAAAAAAAGGGRG